MLDRLVKESDIESLGWSIACLLDQLIAYYSGSTVLPTSSAFWQNGCVIKTPTARASSLAFTSNSSRPRL